TGRSRPETAASSRASLLPNARTTVPAPRPACLAMASTVSVAPGSPSSAVAASNASRRLRTASARRPGSLTFDIWNPHSKYLTGTAISVIVLEEAHHERADPDLRGRHRRADAGPLAGPARLPAHGRRAGR